MEVYSGAAFKMQKQKLDDGRDFICFFPLFPGIIRATFSMVSPTTRLSKEFMFQGRGELVKWNIRDSFVEMMQMNLNLEADGIDRFYYWWKTDDEYGPEPDTVYRVFARETD